MLTVSERQALVVSHLRLANFLAKEKVKRVHQKVRLDELQSAAYMGLVKYTHKYGQTHASVDDQFKPHMRIIGEMKDYLRSLGWGPKGRISAVSFDFSMDPIA
jgi:DNA-directed RNA polymerase specialized sigma subunit